VQVIFQSFREAATVSLCSVACHPHERTNQLNRLFPSRFGHNNNGPSAARPSTSRRNGFIKFRRQWRTDRAGLVFGRQRQVAQEVAGRSDEAPRQAKVKTTSGCLPAIAALTG